MGHPYAIVKRTSAQAAWDNVWADIPTILVDQYPWERNGYRPRTEARLFYTDTALHVQLKSFETRIRARCRGLNEMVCRDSCMELFICPAPERDDRYMNFEINAVGALLLQIGRTGDDRVPAVTREDAACFRIVPSVTAETLGEYRGPFWAVCFQIPFSYFKKYFGKMDFAPGKRMKANFYKCGNRTEFPHHGSWSLIHSESPDFHHPEFFGDLVLGDEQTVAR